MFWQNLKEAVMDKLHKDNVPRCLPATFEGYMLTSDRYLKDYVRKCALLAWRMVTQVPPLTLYFPVHDAYNEKFHTVAGYHPHFVSQTTDPAGANRNPPKEIACYLWPALHEGRKVLQKGVVLLKYKETGV